MNVRSQGHPIILFIDRFGFSIYQDILANIPRFNFTPDLVSNLDVVNKEQFTSLITAFIQINKVVQSSLFVILSDSIIYTKDLVNPEQKSLPNQSPEHKDEIQNFLENVPFEEVLAKVIKVGNVDRITAVNKDLIMTIVNAFTGKGVTIEGIIPGFMYGQSVNFTSGLTLDNVRIVLGNTEIIKSGNLLTNQEEVAPSQNPKNEPGGSQSGNVGKPQNLRQYMLIGIFVTLLVILAVVYLNLGVSQTPPVKKIKKTASIVSSPTVTPVLVREEITTTSFDARNVRIKITQSSEVDEKAVSLKNSLLQIGFVDIVSEISGISIPEKSSAIFSQSIPADLRSNVIVGIKKTLPEISVLESQDVGFTINILIGKS